MHETQLGALTEEEKHPSISLPAYPQSQINPAWTSCQLIGFTDSALTKPQVDEEMSIHFINPLPVVPVHGPYKQERAGTLWRH